jgi:site-specific DNA recombinase
MDQELLDWIVAALKESHDDEKKFHADCIRKLQTEYDKLQHRLDAMYEDKLDSKIDQGFFDRKSSEWKNEQDAVFAKIEHHQNANRSYLDAGIRLLELAQRAVTLYEKQTDQEKRRIIKLVCSNSSWKYGILQPSYRQPFDMIVKNNIAIYQKTGDFST